MYEVILFQDEYVQVTLKDLIVKGAVYPLRDFIESQIDDGQTLQIKKMHRETFSYTWQPVFQSSKHKVIQEIHEAICDAKTIRHFYSGQYLNLPYYFAEYIQVIRKRAIDTLPIKLDTIGKSESIVEYMMQFLDNPLDRPIPLDFDE
jgi:hypothetical protein